MYLAPSFPTSPGTMFAYLKQPPTATKWAEPCPQHWQMGLWCHVHNFVCKLYILLQFCYNFVCKLYLFCIHIVNWIVNFVYNLHTLYTFCLQNWYKIDTFLQIDTFSSGQEFSRIDPEYLQEGTRHEGMNGRVAQHLYNCGHENLWRNRTGEVYGQFFP